MKILTENLCSNSALNVKYVDEIILSLLRKMFLIILQNSLENTLIFVKFLRTLFFIEHIR